MKILRDPDPEDGTGGSDPSEFLQSLPEEIRTNPTISRYKDAESLAKGLIETKKLVGSNADRMEAPKEDWTPEKWDSHFNRLGRPEKPEEYEMPELQLPEGTALDESMLTKARQELHKYGLNKKQFAGVLSLYGNVLNTSMEGAQAARDQAAVDGETTLKTEWGDKYDANLDIARGAIKKFGGDDFTQFLDSSGLGNNPAMVKVFADIGKRIMEDNAGMGRGSGLPVNGETQAKMKIEELSKDKAWTTALTDERDPNHKAVKRERQELYKIAYPGKTTI